MFATRQNGGEQIEFLWRHFCKTVKPQAGNLQRRRRSARIAGRLWTLGFGPETFRRGIEQAVRVLQFMSGEPVCISVVEQREVVKFVLKLAASRQAGGKRAEFFRRQVVVLQFAEQLAELPGKTRTAGAPVEQFEFTLVLHQQRSQNHDAALLGKQLRQRYMQIVKHELRKPLE